MIVIILVICGQTAVRQITWEEWTWSFIIM